MKDFSDKKSAPHMALAQVKVCMWKERSSEYFVKFTSQNYRTSGYGPLALSAFHSRMSSCYIWSGFCFCGVCVACHLSFMESRVLVIISQWFLSFVRAPTSSGDGTSGWKTLLWAKRSGSIFKYQSCWMSGFRRELEPSCVQFIRILF